MSEKLLTILHGATIAAGTASGHCDNAFESAQRGDRDDAETEMALAEAHARDALRRIQVARAHLAVTKGGAA